jgi:hypothetical protein
MVENRRRTGIRMICFILIFNGFNCFSSVKTKVANISVFSFSFLSKLISFEKRQKGI